MSERNFRQMLEAQWARGRFVCVGLDSEYEKIPSSVEAACVFDKFVFFNRKIVSATQEWACAFKLNAAFYLAKGADGLAALWETCSYIRKTAASVPIILDAKQADIGNTNIGYVGLDFDWLQVDAVTVHPYLGGEALTPFLMNKDKGVIVLCRTSNPGAREIQDMRITLPREEVIACPAITLGEMSHPGGYTTPLYKYVAHRVGTEWNKHGNCMLVVGATYPEELAQVRAIVHDLVPILIPGVGAQGGDLEAAVDAGQDSRGKGFVINASRSIIFASSGEDFAEAARKETQRLTHTIRQCVGYKPHCPSCGHETAPNGILYKCNNCGESVT